MSTWFTRNRQDFIRAQLQTFGQIRRRHIVEQFDVTMAIASADIATFVDDHPDLIIYDGRAKVYVLDQDRVTESVTPAAI